MMYVHIYELWISFLEKETQNQKKSIVVSGNSKGGVMGWIGSTQTSFREGKQSYFMYLKDDIQMSKRHIKDIQYC